MLDEDTGLDKGAYTYVKRLLKTTRSPLVNHEFNVFKLTFETGTMFKE